MQLVCAFASPPSLDADLPLFLTISLLLPLSHLNGPLDQKVRGRGKKEGGREGVGKQRMSSSPAAAAAVDRASAATGWTGCC